MPSKKTSKTDQKKSNLSSWKKGKISLKEVSQNNLKGFDLDLPQGKLIVVTGPSGSGKSSLAFQTLYAEGQRRYIETFSPYTRQFFDRMDKPMVKEVHGIPPSIAIEQGNNIRTTRSTVGTLTGINDYLKILFAHTADAFCPNCDEPIVQVNPEKVIQFALDKLSDRSVFICFEIPVPKEIEINDFFKFLSSQGYLRVVIEKQIYRTDEPEAFNGKINASHVHIIQDRIKLSKSRKNRSRLFEAIETSFVLGKGKIQIVEQDFKKIWSFSKALRCDKCDISIKEASAGLFSFNNPIGACPECRGFGRTLGIDLMKALPDQDLSLKEGVVKPFQGERGAECQQDLIACAKIRGVDIDLPFRKLSTKDKEWVLYGEKGDPEANWEIGLWYGVQGFFSWLERKAYKMHVRVFLSRYRSYTTCPSCRGSRLKPDALNFKIVGLNLPELWRLPIKEFLRIWNSQSADECFHNKERDRTVHIMWEEVHSRLQYLNRVGLGYLTLDRSARSLSGGEMQRVHLTTCLGASLVNTLFVLDEPSIGLHPRDTDQLIDVMRDLRDAGNTVLVVEHEESVIRASDQLVDIGPGRGEDGGELVYQGPVKSSKNPSESLTLDYLSGIKVIEVPEKRRTIRKTNCLKIRGAKENNLKDIDVDIPLGVFTCVTGVSGSGKSTLVHNILYRNLMKIRGEITDESPGIVKTINGHNNVGQIVLVDQSTLSKNPRSTPVVYVGAFEFIRKLFAEIPEVKDAGHLPGYFSFNSGVGRCGRCWGNGYEKVEMQFLSDIYVKCSECEGKRYSPQVLEFKLRGKSIHQILELTVDSAITFFKSLDDKKAEKVAISLEHLTEVGLGYLRLGQPLNTLSGGESQRIKLVGHLLKKRSQKVQKNAKGDLLLFDEPTTGLHFDDINVLLKVFHKLVDHGHSVLVIEHNSDVINCSDYVIDLGPEGGEEGGQIISVGTPEEIRKNRKSYTGKFLTQVATNPGKRKPKPKADKNTKALSDNHEMITIRGARENNLKNISLSIPHEKFTVVTGLSGSGKSTLAFDILFAEGQRRFLDSMSAYARQFVQQMERPDVDQVDGLPPTVAIEQRVSRGGGKSTVSTVTEIYHFLRLLYAKVGTQFCPKCNVPVEKQSHTSIVTSVENILKNGNAKLLAPLVRGRKGFHTDTAEWALRQGIKKLVVNGSIVKSEGFIKLERYKEHSIDAIVAEFKKGQKSKTISEAIERAMQLGKGTAKLLKTNGEQIILSTEMSCPGCGQAFEELDPRLFSYNSPHGWCPECRGYGYVPTFKPDYERHDSVVSAELEEEMKMAKAKNVEKELCLSCNGSRINAVARNVRINEISIDCLSDLSVDDAIKRIEKLKFEGVQKIISRDITKEIYQRLTFLSEVGLGYLGLNRSATTLSGGESQRIRLAAQLGSNLRGVLYVLDEPTIGLHPRDNDKLLETLSKLRDQGNSLVVVEHDDSTILKSDHLIDLGPGAGNKGGEIVYEGQLKIDEKKSLKQTKSPTVTAFSKKVKHPIRGSRRKLPKIASGGWIEVKGASINNLNNLDVRIPIGRLTVLSGVSGSGKSSLMRGILKPAFDSTAGKNTKTTIKKWTSIKGEKNFVAAYEVDQSPIGKTSRSTPATYVKVFDEIRKLFSTVPESRIRGYDAGHFSFNTAGGRCDTCGGNGQIKLEMNFLPTTWVQCEECKGARYNPATLEIFLNGKNISDVMNMSISEACEFFKTYPRIITTLELLRDTGLGYLSLGQPSTTLSGGEAQRIKLVAEIRKGQGRAKSAIMKGKTRNNANLYLIEEPTIGLHQNDVINLIEVLHALVDEGHTVVVIEHNLNIMAEADYIIDMGPEAGPKGGKIIAKGPPEKVLSSKKSRTARFLKETLTF